MSVISVGGRNCDNLSEANIVVMAKDNVEMLEIEIYIESEYCGTYKVHGGTPIENQINEILVEG